MTHTTNSSNEVSPALREDLSLVLPAVRAALKTDIDVLIAGRGASLDEGIAKANALIEASSAPAIVGLNGLTIEAVREAVALAELQRMRLLPMPLPEVIAARQVVTQTATLGHAIAADLQIKRQPEPTAGGRRPTAHDITDRIDAYITAGVPNALFMPVDDLDAVLALRAKLRRDGSRTLTDATALPVKRVIVLLPHDCDARVVSQWHRLAVEVQQEIRIAVLSLPSPDAGNLRGALEVITWQTGLSCATGGVEFCDGSPKPCAGANTLLPRGAVDLVIDAGLNALPDALAAHARHRIRIGPSPDPNADVSFVAPGLTVGLAAQVMRFDGVMLWLCENSASAAMDPVVSLLQRLMTGSSAGT